jgi:hypothetical protein
MTIALRPRSGPELLDAAFQFWRENFKLLFTVVAAAFLPIIAIGAVDAVLPHSFESQVVTRVVNAACEALAWGAVIIVVSERYVGHEITASQAIRVVWGRLWTIFWANVIFWFGVYIGMILLIVPGLYLFAKYFAMVPVVVLEGHGIRASQLRSAALTQGAKWRAFAIVCVPWLTYLVLFGAITSTIRDYTSSMTTIVLTRLLIAGVYPFLGILATLLYYDLRFRNEGLDLDLMLAEQPPQSATA